MLKYFNRKRRQLIKPNKFVTQNNEKKKKSFTKLRGLLFYMWISGVISGPSAVRNKNTK